jgi:hypothetical protein
MTTNEPWPKSDDPSSTSGLPSYGSQPPPPGGYPPQAPGGYGAPAQTNKKALWSMILGIVSLVCCGFFAGIPAIILAMIGKKEIAASNGSQTGGGMATAGLILGIIAIAWSVIYLILVLVGAVDLDFSSSTS